MLKRSFTAFALSLSLAACSAPGNSISAIPVPPAATRAETSILASPGGGALALPGGGALALPGGGALALPGGGALALPGGGALALPGGGALALPGGGALALPGGGALALPGGGALALPGGGNAASALLAALVNALPVCALAAPIVGRAQCTALLNTQIPVIDDPLALPATISGLQPSDLRSAYRFASGGGSGQTIAVVDAGDDPTAEADLAVYRNAFNLGACTTENGCFRKVNQAGSTAALPPVVSGWPAEIAIDLQMVVVCPACKILLVEANSADLSDLGASVDTAVALGAVAVSNSYYAPEYSSELTDETHFNHPGVAVTASSGDTGYGPTFPASSRYVTAVGGTSLVRGGLRGWTETVWAATGSGCSAYVTKPAWQHDAGCPNRTVTDVAIVGDPKTGVAIYNTTAQTGQRGWGVYGGTSVGAPMIAALYALAANAASAKGASFAYAHPSAFNPVVIGSNGTCPQPYLCNAASGYSGPAGLGTPNGLGGL